MKRLPLALAAAALALVGSSARAQNPYTLPPINGTYTPPAVSPYNKAPISPWLNLARPGSSPAINYYDLVRPQMQTMNQIQQLQGTTQLLAGTLYAQQNQQTGQVAQTGHTTRFMSYNQYFNTTMTGSNFVQPLAPTMLQGSSFGRLPGR